MKSKTIGIPGYKTDISFGAGINHLEFISNFGNAKIIMPWEKYVKVDLLYLPGGLDTAPSNYGEVPRYNTSNQDVMKEFFFRNRLKNYIEAGTPIFGVCLGMQELAVYFGSKLTQDFIYHSQSDDRWETAHCVWNPNNAKDKFEVNSHHHQGVLMSQLSDELEALYITECEEPFIKSDTDWIVEAFQHKSLPIMGLQWHPEECYDNFSINSMRGLLQN